MSKVIGFHNKLKKPSEFKVVDSQPNWLTIQVGNLCKYVKKSEFYFYIDDVKYNIYSEDTFMGETSLHLVDDRHPLDARFQEFIVFAKESTKGRRVPIKDEDYNNFIGLFNHVKNNNNIMVLDRNKISIGRYFKKRK